ncbi:MBL fold metallo-hydrolase [Amycolatopsis aidingensis]|uniref:MBL fold metallo-hydrolase n=1 Tax=Amycolatopsis aidingensis TaxID=2842453 RepID=UPI001C0CB126|nr:MBL fold metallo-hydrolase [Amycolatopsis aidingensis]
MTAIVQNVVTSGFFQLDGGSWEVDNNVWLLGDDHEVLVIDAAHDAQAILTAVDGRAVRAIVCTHAHNDHVNAAPELARLTNAPILLHPDDLELWNLTHPERSPDAPLSDGQVLTIAGTYLRVLHTPGHAPGAVCLYAEKLGAVFTGDTLFHGGPGATGRSYSDYPTILESIRDRLFALPDDTVVHTGHGEHTSIAAERENSEQWAAP